MDIKSFKLRKVLNISLISLGVLLLLILIVGFVRILPKDIKYTNISSNSFTVSWTTRFPTKGVVSVIDGKNRLPISFTSLGKTLGFDTRDIRYSELDATERSNEKIWGSSSLSVSLDDIVVEKSVTKKGSYYTHHIEVRGVSPESEYGVMVGDGLLFINSNLFKKDSTVKTLEVAKSIETPIPTYGFVKNADNKDLIIEELLGVSDGVIYFNYLEELSGERSNTYSSSLNEEGAWYIDISTAVDSKGELFFEKYSQTIANIYGEVYLDLGPLGQWKKRISMSESSPAETMVINISGYTEEKEDPDVLIRVDSTKGKVVKGASASGCQFVAYCGGCVESVGGTRQECACDSAVLERRGCGGGQNLEQGLQELAKTSKPECSGGGVEGSTVKYGNDCKICAKGDKGFFVWKTIDSNTCNDKSYLGGKIQPPKQSEEKKTNDSNGCVDTSQDVFHSLRTGDECCVNGKKGKVTTYRSCDTGTGQGSGHSGGSDGGDVSPNGDDSSNQNGGPNSSPPEDVRECYERTNNNLYKRNERGQEYICHNGSWIQISSGQMEGYGGTTAPYSGPVYNCGEDAKCQLGSRCYVETEDSGGNIVGKMYHCSWFKVKEVPQGGSEIKSAVNLKILGINEPCPDSDNCYCESGGYKGGAITQDQICPEVASCRNASDDNKTCNTNGAVCQNKRCVSSPLSFYNNIKGVSNKSIAQETSEFILDTQTGMFTNLTEGMYTFTYEGEFYAFSVSKKDLQVKDGNIMVYIDVNKNGAYDKGVDKNVSDLASKIELTNVVRTYDYNLAEGFNFVTFPFLIDYTDSRTAAGLLKKLNSVYGNVFYSISKYDGKWSVVGQNVEVYDNNDFQLIPGQGYIIKANRDISISIVGQPVKLESSEDRAPITLYPGWNLIGTYGSNVAQYTAKSLIKGINKYEPVDFTADNVSRWESDMQRYDGYQLTVENGIDMEYGFDFPINSLQSYFVRVLEGRGNWQPEIK
ncbi:MAG: hypothetical protein ACOX0X_03415 [Candidatus Dojkabacteria bacterium]